MKTAKIVLRIIGWFSFISGLALFVICMLMEYNQGILISVRGWFNLESAFMIGAVVGLCGLIMVMIIEDKANWESICKWIENRKKR